MDKCCKPLIRQKNAAATREAMLEAARARFLMESYENVGLRDIAADVGVDVALVSRYFGGKEKLFEEVLCKTESNWLPDDVSQEELPAFLTRMFDAQSVPEHRKHAEDLLIVLRSASSPVAAQLVRDSLRADILQPLADHLQGEGAEIRASMSMAVWMGATIMRTILAMEPMCDRKCEVITAKLQLLYEAALSEY